MKKINRILSVILLAVMMFSLIGCNKNKVDDDNTNPSVNNSNGNNGGNNDGIIDPSKTSYKAYSFNYFDTVTTIVGYEKTQDEFAATYEKIMEVVGEYHKLFDIYNEYSGMVNICTINKLYDGQHKEFVVDSRIIDMLLYAKKMYEVTDGNMNIAMGSVLSIWHDYRTAGIDNPTKAELPPMDKLQEAAKHTNIDNLIIDKERSTVYISDPQMTLDVGAIAKGYAVDMVAKYVESLGKYNYAINIGGNIQTTGPKATGDKWKTGIENPGISSDATYIQYVGLNKEAIVTSGSYQRFYIVNGKSYHHIIDADTLMPSTGFVSVTVICKSSADGDGLSTALFCMSLEDGMALVNSLEGVEALWVTEDEVIHYSNNFSKHIWQ